MHDSTVAAGTARQAFLAKLIDDASLFAGGDVPMERALAAHTGFASGPDGWVQGSFMVPAPRFGEFAAARRGPVSVGIVLDPGPGAWLTGVAGELLRVAEALDPSAGGVTVRALEMRVPINTGTKALRGILSVLPPRLAHRELELFFEIPLGDHWRDDLPLAADAVGGLNEELLRAGEPVRAGAKLRCGGACVPSAEQVACFISEFAERHVRIKLAAGLNRALPQSDPAAGMQHGFLNVIGAAIFCEQRMLDDLELVEVLEETDPLAFTLDDKRFAWRDFELGPIAVMRARERFIASLGSCATRTPLEQLRRLGFA